MADANLEDFARRLRRIDKQHARLARGFVTVVNADGLLVAQPRRQSLRFPWKWLAVILVSLFLLKGLILASLGEAEYTNRVLALHAGTPVEQVGGWIMRPDPLTVWFAGYLGSLI